MIKVIIVFCRLSFLFIIEDYFLVFNLSDGNFLFDRVINIWIIFVKEFVNYYIYIGF